MTGRQGQGESSTSPRRLTAVELEDKCFAMRKTGMTYQEMGDELGVTRQRAHAAVKRALAKMPPLPELLDFRRTEIATLDAMQAALWSKVEAKDPEACRVVVRIMERRTKLVGGDVLPSLNAVGVDVVQGVFDQIVGMAVRLLAEEQRPAFLAQVETTLLQIEAPRQET